MPPVQISSSALAGTNPRDECQYLNTLNYYESAGNEGRYVTSLGEPALKMLGYVTVPEVTLTRLSPSLVDLPYGSGATPFV